MARQIALVRFKEEFGLVLSFLAINSCNLSCYIKTNV